MMVFEDMEGGDKMNTKASVLTVVAAGLFFGSTHADIMVRTIRYLNGGQIKYGYSGFSWVDMSARLDAASGGTMQQCHWSLSQGWSGMGCPVR